MFETGLSGAFLWIEICIEPLKLLVRTVTTVIKTEDHTAIVSIHC